MSPEAETHYPDIGFLMRATYPEQSARPESATTLQACRKRLETCQSQPRTPSYKATVVLPMDFYRRTYGTDAYVNDFPGLTKESATWLGKRGITMFGDEALSPGRTGRNNFEVHHVCRDLGFTHMEGLVNLDQLVGKGRFRFIGFPLKIKGGSGSPIRAVALLDDE